MYNVSKDLKYGKRPSNLNQATSNMIGNIGGIKKRATKPTSKTLLF